MRIGACLLCAVLAGCVVSVQPVVPSTVSEFDARLLGQWGETDGKDHVTVTRGDGNSYDIEYVDSDGKVGLFQAQLGRLGRRTVLDVQPAPRSSSPMPEAASFIRGHIVYVLGITQDSVLVSLLSPRALRAAIKARTVALASFDDHDQLVLTGTTAELTRVLAGYTDKPGALDEPSTWRRIGQREVGPDSVEREVLAELAVMRSGSAAGDWSVLKRFFIEGSPWAAQAERWITSPDAGGYSFFARTARNEPGVRVRVISRDTADVLIPYSVMGSHADYAARLVLGKTGWVLWCSHEAHGERITEPGCGGSRPGDFRP